MIQTELPFKAEIVILLSGIEVKVRKRASEMVILPWGRTEEEQKNAAVLVLLVKKCISLEDSIAASQNAW